MLFISSRCMLPKMHIAPDVAHSEKKAVKPSHSENWAHDLGSHQSTLKSTELLVGWTIYMIETRNAAWPKNKRLKNDIATNRMRLPHWGVWELDIEASFVCSLISPKLTKQSTISSSRQLGELANYFMC